MAQPPIFYYITDRTSFAGDEALRRRQLLDKVAEAATCNIDFVQLREKDLSTRELEQLATEALQIIRVKSSITRLLINSRADIALAVHADGVHLRADDLPVRTVRALRSTVLSRHSPANMPKWLIGVSCHSDDEVRRAAADEADFVVFAPVFEKRGAGGVIPVGLDELNRVSRHDVPVLALGGVTLDNAQSCLDAGAAGIAGIRLFQDNNVADVVRRIRG